MEPWNQEYLNPPLGLPLSTPGLVIFKYHEMSCVNQCAVHGLYLSLRIHLHCASVDLKEYLQKRMIMIPDENRMNLCKMPLLPVK